MKRRPATVAVLLLPFCLFLASVLVSGCSTVPVGPTATAGPAPTSQPATGPTTEPSTQPTSAPAPAVAAPPTAGQVLDQVGGAIETYGPLAQAVLSLIPGAAGGAMGVGVTLLVVSAFRRRFTGANAPTTPAQLLSDVELFAQDIASQVLTVIPGAGRSAAEVQAIVNVVKAATTAQIAASPTIKAGA